MIRKSPRKANQTMVLWALTLTLFAGQFVDLSKKDWRRPRRQSKRLRPSEDKKEESREFR